MQKVLTTHYLPKVVGRVLLEGPDLNKVVLIQAAPLRELNRPLPPLEDRGFLPNVDRFRSSLPAMHLTLTRRWNRFCYTTLQGRTISRSSQRASMVALLCRVPPAADGLSIWHRNSTSIHSESELELINPQKKPQIIALRLDET